GLAADATDGTAVARIYERKGRPRFNPLIVHVADSDAAWTIGERSPIAEALAARFWPGPLTMVLQARLGNGIAALATAGLDTVAVRVPGHPVARALIAAVGRPLAAPSANRSGRISPTSAADVIAELGQDLTVLDGGPCERGLESTIVALTGASGSVIALLRSGSIPAEAVEAVAGVRLDRDFHNGFSDGTKPIAPGQLASHYAPKAQVRLNATDVGPGEALLAFERLSPSLLAAAHTTPVINLSPSGDLVEAARNLFGALRRLDATGVAGIAVMPIPAHGLGEAINDRLARAASARR
ncbi:MAG: L-threonylcarbamoyladenylate synthase, partial [Hyphomicrobiaceae bacterium]|nr:L-threonylcarbamoyladenylate synthase [Hyphomicrobiaceae bacterium]